MGVWSVAAGVLVIHIGAVAFATAFAVLLTLVTVLGEIGIGTKNVPFKY